MHVFILAGGFATRLWPLTEKRAKPLLPLAGKPILSHIVEKIPADLEITISTNAAFEDGFESWKEEYSRENISVVVEKTRSDDEKLGALGAVAEWISESGCRDDLLLLTGDNYFGFTLSSFLSSIDIGIPSLAACDIKDTKLAQSFGTVVLGEDRKTVDAFEEKPALPRSTLVSTGCSYLPASLFPVLLTYAREHPDNVGGIFEECIAQGIDVTCVSYEDQWFDIGSFDSYLTATKAIVGDTALKASTASIEQSDQQGSIVIGKGSTVMGSTLKDVVIFEDCRIEDCTLTECILDNGCHLRGVDLYGKMLRDSTILSLPHAASVG